MTRPMLITGNHRAYVAGAIRNQIERLLRQADRLGPPDPMLVPDLEQNVAILEEAVAAIGADRLDRVTNEAIRTTIAKAEAKIAWLQGEQEPPKG